jgi:hypothetical protein
LEVIFEQFYEAIVSLGTSVRSQITSDFPKSCQALESKIFRFRCNPNHRYHFGHPPRQEGRIAIVTDAGLDAVDAAASGAIVVAGRVLP